MQNEKTVRLGLMPPLTGIVEMYGQEISWAAKIACDEINKAGGILGKPLEIVIEDDGSLPESAVKAAEKLVKVHRCAGLIGNLLSNSRMAVALRVAEPYKVPLLNFSFYEGGISSPYFYNFAALPNQQIGKMIPYMKQKFGPKMFFAGNNYEWPRGSIDAAKRSLMQVGGEIVGEEYYPIGTDIKDIDQLLIKLKNSGANVFVPYFAGTDQIKLLTRFTEVGLKQQMAVVMGHFDEVMVSKISPKVRSGFFSSNTYFMTLDTLKNKNYLQRLSELPEVTAIWPEGNGILTNFGEGVYLCVNAFAKAANSAKSLDPDKFKEALEKISVAGPQGSVIMNAETHHAEVNTYLSQSQEDGTFSIIERFGRIPAEIPERYRFSTIGSGALHEEDMRLQARIVDQMNEMVFLINSVDQTIVYSNPSARRMFGYSEGEFVGCKTSRLFISFGVQEALSENNFKDMNEALYRKGIWQGNLYCTRKNGADFWCTASVTAFTHGEYGEVWMAVLSDITQYLTVEKENEQNKKSLLESNMLFNRAEKLAKIGYFNFNTATGKFIGSDEFYNLFEINKDAGYSEVMGAIHPEDYSFCVEIFQTSLLTKKGYNTDYRLLLAGNRVRFINAIGDVVEDTSTSDLLVTGFVQDITDQKLAESELQQVKKAAEEGREQLAQAQRFEALGRLASGVSHDFNNILSIISGCAELLRLESDSDSQKIDIDSILKATERASALTAQLLAYSRRQPLLNEKLNLNVILNEMSQILNRMIGVNIKLEMQLSDFVYINSDRSQIEQIILNLIKNAKDALPLGGVIRVSTEVVSLPSSVYSPAGIKKGDYVRLCVADNGTGIKTDDLPLIFEPFFSTKSQQGGTGLGLSTVYGIVKQYGGHIDIDTKENEYAIFNIYLPALSAEDFNMNPLSDDAQNNSESPVSTLTNKIRPKVLIVEDEVDIRRALVKLFISEDYDVVAAEDGESALAIYGKADAKFDLIITDFQLPKISGEELVSVISQIDSHIKFILISGLAESNFIKLPDAEARLKILRKPFRLAGIVKAANELLNSVKH